MILCVCSCMSQYVSCDTFVCSFYVLCDIIVCSFYVSCHIIVCNNICININYYACVVLCVM